MRATQFLILVAAVTMLPCAAFPKSAPCSTESVLATVVDQKGIPVRGLNEANFRARFHRRPLQILSVAPWTGPARVLLLFDVSGSMWNWILLEKKIGAQIISGADPKTSFAMAVFSSRVDKSVPFTAGAAAVTKEISALNTIAKGVPKNDRKTAIFDAIKESLSMFGKPRPGDVICLVTDGSENRSQLLMRQLNQPLLANGIRLYPIFLIALDNIRLEHLNDFSGIKDIRALAKRSGGMAYLLRTESYWDTRRWSSSVMETALSLCPLLDLQFVNGYIIGTRVTAALRKPTGWELEVIGQGGKVDQRLAVSYPRLSPCQATP